MEDPTTSFARPDEDVSRWCKAMPISIGTISTSQTPAPSERLLDDLEYSLYGEVGPLEKGDERII